MPFIEPCFCSAIVQGYNDQEGHLGEGDSSRDEKEGDGDYRRWVWERCSPGREYKGSLPPHLEVRALLSSGYLSSALLTPSGDRDSPMSCPPQISKSSSAEHEKCCRQYRRTASRCGRSASQRETRRNRSVRFRRRSCWSESRRIRRGYSPLESEFFFLLPFLPRLKADFPTRHFAKCSQGTALAQVFHARPPRRLPQHALVTLPRPPHQPPTVRPDPLAPQTPLPVPLHPYTPPLLLALLLAGADLGTAGVGKVWELVAWGRVGQDEVAREGVESLGGQRVSERGRAFTISEDARERRKLFPCSKSVLREMPSFFPLLAFFTFGSVRSILLDSAGRM